MPCTDTEKCGRPQDGPGHPRKGWIRTHVAGTSGSTRWWCSLRCLIAGMTGVPGADRDDVAACVTCTNRHDRDHRCPVCGTRPQQVQGVPTAATPRTGGRIFQNLGRSA
ncbi:hypothetical protein [Phycicoccus avicenniae]|uniref:hypothetical protein n=1 Tax=Phycicoccus avicenniae TaxID=2828860 RepID=UPI003D2E488B